MYPFRMVLGLVLLVVSLGVPVAVRGDALDTRHASIIDPLLYGSGCTSTTLNAALSVAAAAGTASRVLMLTPVDRARDPCVWTITGNVTVPRTVTLWVPQGATAAISGAITLTVNGPLIADDPRWWRGPGTLAAPLPTVPRTASSIEDGCLPTVPSASLTLPPFACQALIAQSDHLWGVAQEPAAVTLAATADVQWVAVCRDVETLYPGWSRVPETHYLHCAAATRPPAPPGCLVLTRVTVSAGAIAAVEPVASAQKTRADTDILYAEDFGAVFTQGGPEDVTADDCGAAITAALAALPADGGTIQLGRGSCNVLSTIDLTKPVRLLGHGPATKLMKGTGLGGPVLRVGGSAVHLADFDIEAQATGVAGNGIDILASAGSMARVGVYLQPGNGIQVCHPTIIATCTGWSFLHVRAAFNGGAGLLFHGHEGSPTFPNNNAGHTVHGGAFTGNAGDGMTLINTVHNTIVAPDISANGVFGIHLASWTFENTISVGRIASLNFGPYDVVIGASGSQSFGNYIVSMPSNQARLVDQTPLGNGSNTFVYHAAGAASTVQTGLGALYFDGLPHGVPMGYLRTHPTVGSGLAVVTEGEALTEANAKLVVKKSGVRLGGPGSSTMKSNSTVNVLLNFGATIPANTMAYALVDIVAILGDACYASPGGALGTNVGYCGCRISAPNVAQICVVNPTPGTLGVAAVTWRTVVFNY